MKELILKDFRVLKFANLLTILICIVGSYIGSTLDHIILVKISYLFAIMLSSHLLTLILSQKEIKTNSDIIINSLPVDRSLIVKSKYIFTMIYIIFLSAIVFVVSNIFGDVGATFLDLMTVLGLSLLFYSAYFIIYYFNLGKAQLFNQFFFIIITLSPNVLNRLDRDIFSSKFFKYILNLNFNIISSLLFVIGLILYIISLGISIKIYKSKEI